MSFLRYWKYGTGMLLFNLRARDNIGILKDIFSYSWLNKDIDKNEVEERLTALATTYFYVFSYLFKAVHNFM